MRRAAVIAGGALLALASACSGGDGGPGTTAIFLVRACVGSDKAPLGETFRVRVEDPDLAARLDARVGLGTGAIVSGVPVSGDGGFNAPWSWHLDPSSIALSDNAIELCDGCPSDVEADLAYWIGTVGRFCPWTSEVVRRER